MLDYMQEIFLVKTNKKLVNNKRNYNERIRSTLNQISLYGNASHQLRRLHRGLLCSNNSYADYTPPDDAGNGVRLNPPDPTYTTFTAGSPPPPTISINAFTNNQVANATITDTVPNELAVSGECDLTAPGWPVQVVGEAVVGATNGVVKAVTNATTCGALQQNATNTSITNSFWNTTFTREQLSELQAANMRAQFYARTANTAGVTSHSATTNQLFVEPDIAPFRDGNSDRVVALLFLKILPRLEILVDS